MSPIDEWMTLLPTVSMWIAITLVIFLILREVVTWYWKINKIVRLLEKIEENTRTSKITPVTPEV